jgi:hypothetical protein
MTGDSPRRGVQLITYADRLGGDMAGLKAVVGRSPGGVFEGVHILPWSSGARHRRTWGCS